MIKNIAIGVENEKYYVQACCGDEHKGQCCECKAIAEDISEDTALLLGRDSAMKFDVPLHFWYKR